MIFRLHLLLILIVGFVLSCSTGPEFERTNENDPGSPNFVPDIRNFSATINPDKTVSLNWTDDSDFKAGFIISKSFGSDTSFFVIDTLPDNSNSYIDVSKKLDLDTYYKISANVTSANQNELPGIIKKLSFSNSLNPKAQAVGNKVQLSWNSSDNFFDKIKVEKKVLSEWVTIYESENDDSLFVYEEPRIDFKIDFKISSFLYTNEESFSILETTTLENTQFNYPTDLSVEITSEATARFNWIDQTSFNDRFILLQEIINDEEISSFVPLDTAIASGAEVFIRYNPDRNYKFSVIPVLNEKKGTVIQQISKQIISRKPEITSYTSISENELSINWIDNNTNASPQTNEFVTYKFYLFIYDELGNLVDSIEKESNEKSHTFSNLSSNNSYQICIRSYSSPCEEKSFENTFHASIKKSTRYDTGYSNFEFSENNLLYAIPRYNVGPFKTIHVFNGLDGELIKSHSFDFEFRSYSVSPDENLIALINGNKTKVIDISTDQYEILNENEYNTTDVFYDDSTMVLGNNNSIYFWNVYTNKLTLKGIIEDEKSDYFVTDIFTNKYTEGEKNILFKYKDTSLNNSLYYHYNPESNQFTSFDNNQQIFGGLNEQGEGLIIQNLFEKVPKVLKVNSTGIIINEYSFPFTLIDQRVVGGSYVHGGFILTFTTNGLLQVFDEISEEYLSSTRFTPVGDINLGANVYSAKLVGSYSQETFLFYYKGGFDIYEIKSSWTEIIN